MRILFYLLTFLFTASCLHAQDIVTMRNGEEIPCKVVEITPDMVKYKRYSNLDGPTISINKSEVFMIKYENGSKDVFGTEKPDTNSGNNNTGNNNTGTQNNGNGPVTVTYSRLKYDRAPRDHENYNLVKFGLLSFFNGDYPFYYERRLGDHVAGEVSLGLTHRDLLYEGLIFDFGTDDSEEHGARFGYSARIGLHLYPSEHVMALEDWYFGPEIHVRQHNTTLERCGTLTLTNPIKEYRRLFDFRITGGYISYLGDQVIIDWFGAIGIRSRDEYRATCDFSGPLAVVGNPVHTRDVVPLFTGGVKIGFAFK